VPDDATQVDLTGGYYDSGDNVKFGLPMAFTVTMLAWSVVEHEAPLAAAGELRNALAAVRWGADYLARAHAAAETLYVQVGDMYPLLHRGDPRQVLAFTTSPTTIILFVCDF
jgi:hypothetical protein